MGWTAPMTFAASTPLTAAQLNTHLRDNLLYLKSERAHRWALANAKSVGTGAHFYVPGLTAGSNTFTAVYRGRRRDGNRRRPPHLRAAIMTAVTPAGGGIYSEAVPVPSSNHPHQYAPPVRPTSTPHQYAPPVRPTSTPHQYSQHVRTAPALRTAGHS